MIVNKPKRKRPYQDMQCYIYYGSDIWNNIL